MGTTRGQTVRDFLGLRTRLALAVMAVGDNHANFSRLLWGPQGSTDRESGAKIKTNRRHRRGNGIHRSPMWLQANRSRSKIPLSVVERQKCGPQRATGGSMSPPQPINANHNTTWFPTQGVPCRERTLTLTDVATTYFGRILRPGGPSPYACRLRKLRYQLQNT